MTLELLKLYVQPVVVERDDNGVIVGERVGDVATVYTLDQLAELAAEIRVQLARHNLTNGGATYADDRNDDDPDRLRQPAMPR